MALFKICFRMDGSQTILSVPCFYSCHQAELHRPFSMLQAAFMIPRSPSGVASTENSKTFSRKQVEPFFVDSAFD